MKNANIFKVSIFNINDAFPAGERFKDPALGLGYLKSYFDKYSVLRDKIEVKILKFNIWATLMRENPDLIGISSVTQDYTNAIRYAKKIKEADSKALIIIGGIHISNLPESFSDVFDIAVLGEAEETMKELIETIYEYGFDKEKLKRIKGILYKEKDEIINTGSRGLIENLDTIPSPYRKYLKESTFLHILTARGCPYQCAYCSSTSFWGFKVRFHSAERVVDEMIELIKDYNLRHISIWDDLFSINKKRLHQINDLMKSNKDIFRKISFGVTARANVVDDELCTLLKEMRVRRVSFGIESGSNRILKLLNRGLNVEQNYSAIKTLKKYGFTVNGGFIVGSPEETEEDLNQTYNFVLESELDGGGIGIAVPYPNTHFWDAAKERGFVSETMDFSQLSLITQPDTLKASDDFILLTKYMDKEIFLRLALKIHNIFVKKNAKSLFNYKTLNLRNIIIVLRNPLKFTPFIISTVKKLIRAVFANV